ncbi:MAG: nucleotidyltransferase [Sphingobacteriales bacterium]|nr:nucleotidyltransferase [Sphingobacteriales bacterium]
MQPTLVILAAGMASRYGSMKQIQSFGPSGETIMDYSIYDAIRAGFGKVVFIIRKDFADQFKEIFEPKLTGKIKTDYVFQDMNSFTNDFVIPAERTKPWGTAHAVLCAKSAVKEPFAVINADDFYGRDAFEKAVTFLTTDCSEQLYSIIGYELEKTLSPHGTVSRGVCDVNANGELVAINERVKVYKKDSAIVYEDENGVHVIPDECKASMNFWCFHNAVFKMMEAQFSDFLRHNLSNPKAEFFIPIVGDEFIKSGSGKIKVIPTSSQWFGVTYKEDAPGVQQNVSDLVRSGQYPPSLWQ